MLLARTLTLVALALPAFSQEPAPATASSQTASSQEEAGPAVLSRGQAPAELTSPQVVFQPFVNVSAVYNRGLTGVTVNSRGQRVSDNSIGVDLTGGISGVHSWKHTVIGLDYQGSLYHYANASFYDGTDQTLLFSISHQLTRHTSFSLRQTAGTFTRSYGLLGLNQTVLFDPSLSYIPTSNYFDNRTFYLSSQADYAIQKTARLSFDLGGDWFLNRRRSTALYGVTGAAARGDAAYRITRRTTVGVGYSYTHYKYHGVLSGTDLHSVVGNYSVRLTPRIELAAYGGVMRSEITYLQNVAIDPIIALLIGRSLGTQVIHRIDYVPNLSGRLSRSFSRGVAYVSAGRSVSPGNGLFLTSTVTTVSGGYNYVGFRGWTVDSQAAYTRANSLGNVIGNYGSTSGGVTFSRRLAAMLHLVCEFQVRRYQSTDFTNYGRTVYTAQIGLGFSPGDLPLRVW